MKKNYSDGAAGTTPAAYVRQKPSPTEFFAVLANAVEELPGGPAKVGRHILADPAAVVPMTIADLAAASSTSDPSVVRLARALGCGGYRELRALVAQAVGAGGRRAGGTAAFPGDIEPEDSPEVVVQKLAAAEIRAIEDTRQMLDDDALGKVAGDIVRARRILIMGLGASGLVAEDLGSKLERIGLPAVAATETHRALTLASLMGQGDLVILISASGHTLDVLEVFDAAREAGCTIAAVTNRPSSPLRDADAVLISAAARESGMRPGAITSRTGQMFVVDALFVLVFQRMEEAATEAMTTSHDLLKKKRAQRR